jgi:hypothetical protein
MKERMLIICVPVCLFVSTAAFENVNLCYDRKRLGVRFISYIMNFFCQTA